jgi:hypothetical protein
LTVGTLAAAGILPERIGPASLSGPRISGSFLPTPSLWPSAMGLMVSRLELASSPFQQTYSRFVYLNFAKSNPESQVSVSLIETQKLALVKSVVISTPA